MKKKFLIGTLVSIAAVAAGVAPTITVSTNTQAINLDIDNPPVNPVDPANPTPPVEEPLISLYPKSLTDSFTYEIKYSGSSDDAGLDSYLKSILESNNIIDIKYYLSNKEQYQNVNIIYVDNRANWDEKTFEIEVVPVEGSEWESGDQSTPKFIKVSIQNFTLDQVEPTPPVEEPLISLYPKSLTDSFNYEIKYSGSSDDAGLDSYLRSILKSDNAIDIKDYLSNKEQYQNVNITYVENKADWAKKTFEIEVAPVEDSKWEIDDSDASKLIKVSIQNFKTNWVLDAVAPTRAKINETINNRAGIVVDSNLNNTISSSMAKNTITLSSNDNSTTAFTNVDIKYVPDSAKLANKTFQVTVTPKVGHAWKDNTTSPKTITVDIPNINWAGNTVNYQSGWTANEVINNNFDFDYWYTKKEWYYGTNNTVTQDRWINVFGYAHWNAKILQIIRDGYGKYIKQQIFNTAVKDYQKAFAVDIVGNYQNAVWDDAILSQSWYFTIFSFKTNVKPKAGYTWADGTNGAKAVKFNLWSCNLKFAPFKVGDTGWLEELPSAVTWNHNDLNLPKKFISFDGFEANFNNDQWTRPKTLKRMEAELTAAYGPWYKIETSNLRTINGKSDFSQPWLFDIKFTSVSDPTKVRNSTGYIFNSKHRLLLY